MSLHAVAGWKGGFSTSLEDGRGHTVEVDEPKGEGGEDLGTSALELNLLSLAGCISTVFAHVAHRRRMHVDDLKIELEGTRPRNASTFTMVRGTCTITTVDPPEEAETALRLTLKICPVGILYERAGIPVTVRAIVQSPPEKEQHAPSPSDQAPFEPPSSDEFPLLDSGRYR